MYRDSKQGRGLEIHVTVASFSSVFPQREASKADSSDMVWLFCKKIIVSQRELSADVPFVEKTPFVCFFEAKKYIDVHSYRTSSLPACQLTSEVFF